MFRPNTVFVIGAGASAEFGFPVGWELMNRIKGNSRFRFDSYRMSEGDGRFYQLLERRYPDTGERNERLTALGEINRAIDSAGSIDEFIYRNQHDPLIAEMGKVQIAYNIALAEAESKMVLDKNRPSDGINFDELSKTWIDQYAFALFNGVRTTEVDTLADAPTIICFNYDRCIELYLSQAIHRSFKDVSLQRAHAIVDAMNIIHPYGTLGHLPYQGGPNNGIQFGPSLTSEVLWAMADKLLTFSESVRDPEIQAKMDHAIGNAEHIIFLGFSFANQNMRLLHSDAPDRPHNRVRLYATAHGMARQVNEGLMARMANLFNDSRVSDDSIQIENDMKCAQFMKTHLMNFME